MKITRRQLRQIILSEMAEIGNSSPVRTLNEVGFWGRLAMCWNPISCAISVGGAVGTGMLMVMEEMEAEGMGLEDIHLRACAQSLYDMFMAARDRNGDHFPGWKAVVSDGKYIDIWNYQRNPGNLNSGELCGPWWDTYPCLYGSDDAGFYAIKAFFRSFAKMARDGFMDVHISDPENQRAVHIYSMRPKVHGIQAPCNSDWDRVRASGTIGDEFGSDEPCPNEA